MSTLDFLQAALAALSLIGIAFFILPRAFSWRIENGYFNVYFGGIVYSRVKIKEIKKIKSYNFWNLPSNSVYINMSFNPIAYFRGRTVVIQAQSLFGFYAFSTFEAEKIMEVIRDAMKMDGS